MSTIATKLAATEREADAARVRAKLRAAKLGSANAALKITPELELKPSPRQKFYLGSSFAVRFDLRGIAYNGPDVLTGPDLNTAKSVVSASQFTNKLQFGTLLSAGVVYLLPSF